MLKEQLYPICKPEDELAFLVGETLAGEKAAVTILERLLENTRHTARRRLLRHHLADEKRHVELYAAWFSAKGLSIRASTNFADQLVAWCSDLKNPHETDFILHVLLESAALAAIRYRNEVCTCPMLRDIDDRVAADELRHVQFARSAGLGGSSYPIPSHKRYEELTREMHRLYSHVFSQKAVNGYFRRGTFALKGDSPPVNMRALRRFAWVHAKEIQQQKARFLQSHGFQRGAF